MPQVALSSEFLTAFAQIPRKRQKTVRETLEKFKRDPTTSALNFEPIHNMSDGKIRTLRCGLDYRAIVVHPPKGDVFLFVWVDHHDEAMAWARRKRFEINKHTGTLQVYEVLEQPPEPEAAPKTGDVTQADSTTGAPTTADSTTADSTTTAWNDRTNEARLEAGSVPGEPALVESVPDQPIPEGRYFAGHDNTTLLLFGVPEPLLPAVRALREEVDFENLVPYLPREAADALYYLAAGYTAEQTIDELDRAKPAAAPQPAEFDPEDFSASLERPETQRLFKVVEDEHELADILNAPLAKWRVFLHPSQRKLARMQSKGPVRVLGGAGTGKTVVAMHRAQHLAKTLSGDKKVLFTTYTRNLAADIEAQLGTLCGEEMARIEVQSIHAWASSTLSARGVKVRIASDEVREKAWEDARSLDTDETYSAEFYRSEWSEIVQAQGLLDEASYLRARRAGRGTRLNRERRKLVWSVLEAYRRSLQRAGHMDQDDVIREARLLLESGKVPQRYAAVVADEVQDFSEATLKLLRAIVPEGPNDLFLVGDAHQRIYGRKTSLSRCGISVRGQRSKRLRLNYRTTEAIRNYSVALLRGMDVDDLDEGSDDALKGYHSLRSGTPPLTKHHPSEVDEAAFILEQIERWLHEQHRKPSDICVVARTHALLQRRYAPLLENHGHAVHFVKTEDSNQGEGIRIATMHRVKGLEFPCVLIVGVQHVPLELGSYADEVAKRDHYDSEKRLLFVAATRARDELVVTGFGQRSELWREGAGR